MTRAIAMNVAKQYYLHPRHGAVAIRPGFSWTAFFFGALWAAATRMGLPAFALMLALEAGLWLLTGYAGERGAGLLMALGLTLMLACAVVRGLYGNRWREALLLRRGYVAAAAVR